jgi:hypothetical protein
MLIQPLVGWVKSLAEQFSKPQTYGSELEQYIVSHEPQNAGDVDRLIREFDRRKVGSL